MTWWQQTVFYEIYVRSFQDSNGDGIGDLNGITRRLDYLADLGVGGIWITPFYRSPQVDYGYDVSDHEDVDPLFGTLADFDRLVDAAHARGIRVIVDVVLNHTSDRHRWFDQSRRSRTSPRRDWYIWQDGAPDGGPPNNWESAFGGPAWTFDHRTGQWYYHFFYAEQPDLNWRNPAVERRMHATLKFWLDRGVDGFRLDAVNTLFEDPMLRDNPPLAAPKIGLTGVRTQDFVQTRRLPDVHDALRRVRRFVDRHRPETVLISEAYVDEVAELACFYGSGDEMHLPFNFFLAQVPTLDAAAFRRIVAEIEGSVGADRWPSLVLSNHDIDRACDRFVAASRDGGGGERDRVARLLAMMLLTLRGSPFIYYGEEIGMRTEDPDRLEEVRDPVGRTFWPRYKGRDGERRPMCWERSHGAGFTSGTPWLALSSDAADRNVAGQQACAGSLLTFYRTLLAQRRSSRALSHGRYRALESHPDVFAFERWTDAETAVVLLNMSSQHVDADLRHGRTGCRYRVALGSHRPSDESIALDSLRLSAFESLLAYPAAP